MRSALIVVLVALAAAAVWFLNRTPPPPAPTGDTETMRAPRPVEPVAPPTTRVETPGETVVPAERDPPPDPATRVEPAATVPGAARLEVGARPDGAAVPAFRYTLVHGDGRRESQLVQGTTTTLQLQVEQFAVLRVEADGFDPVDDVRVRATALEPNPIVRVLLTPKAAGSGVRFHVNDAQLQAVPRIRLSLWRIQAGDAVGDKLWTRERAETDGTYRLPELTAGRYRYEVSAIESNGDVRPLHLQLPVGAQLRVRAKDGDGNPLGTTVAIRILDVAGNPVPARFSARLGAERVVRENGLPAPTEAMLESPLVPGMYTLEWRVEAGPIQRRQLLLADGEVLDVELP
jgi:hypothetical protein